MLNTAGLSLEQAPPLGVPFGFFLTAPWFAVAAGLVLVWSGADLLLTRWAPATLAAAHLLGLGFLGLVIVGALFQLLPVLCGAPVPGAVWVSRTVYGLLVVGIPLLVTGFLTSRIELQLWALAPLGAGLLVLVSAFALALRAARSATETGRVIELSLGSLLVTFGLGATIVLALNARVGLLSWPAWVDLHLSWALLGWAGLLLVGVGFQLVPLFHVTPPYPPRLRQAAPLLLFGALLAMMAGHLVGSGTLRSLGVAAALLVLGVFALLTLRLQAARRRAVWDPTLSFWWLGLASLLGAALAWFLDAPATAVGVLALPGVGVALPSGVLYKVAPFLAWYHLQALQLQRGRLDLALPHVKSLLGDRAAHGHFALHASALALLLAVLAGWDTAARPAGALFAAGALLQAANLARVYARYRHWRRRLISNA